MGGGFGRLVQLQFIFLFLMHGVGAYASICQRFNTPAFMVVCEQVARLEAELRQARQAGDAAENKATAAAKDLRQLGSLEEEVRRLRSQALVNDKRRTKDTKSLKDAEARASTLDARLSERDSQVETLQKQLAAVRYHTSPVTIPPAILWCF